MSDAPAPLLPPYIDVRDLDGFLLNVERLLASELVAIGSPEECWAALMLWCRAWKQMPAGSLPDDDRILASFSGAGKRWPKVRDVALHGFVKCSDGRLYHRFLCAEAKRAFGRKISFQERREADRDRLSRWREKRKRDADETRFTDVSSTLPETDFVAEGTGTGTGTGTGISLSSLRSDRGRARARESPTDWLPKQIHYDLAASAGFNEQWTEDHAQRYRDWLANHPRHKDFDAGFRNWLKSTIDKAADARANGRSPSSIIAAVSAIR